MSALKVGDKLFDVSFVSDSRPVQDGVMTRFIIDGRGHFAIEAHTVTRVTPKFFWIRRGSDEALASGRSPFRPDHVERGDRAAFESGGDVLVNRHRFYDREHAEAALAKVLAREAERGASMSALDENLALARAALSNAAKAPSTRVRSLHVAVASQAASDIRTAVDGLDVLVRAAREELDRRLLSEGGGA